jgi:hypothetical protein
VGIDSHHKKILTDAAWKKVAELGEKNVVAIGFGIALKSHIPDLSRPSVMRFYVKKKSDRKHKLELRHELTLRLDDSPGTKSRARGRTIKVSTDVYELPKMVGAGRSTYLVGTGRVTSGLVVRWEEEAVTAAGMGSRIGRFGVVTVAHSFVDQPLNRKVFIEAIGFGVPIVGTRVCQSVPATDGIDACLVDFKPEDGIRAGILSDPLAPALQMKAFDDLHDDQDKVGASFQATRTVSYSVAGTLDSAPISNVGTKLSNLLHVQGGHDAFVYGTSGSILGVFEAKPQGVDLLPSAIQLGADERTFSMALGQSLEVTLGWIQRQLTIQLFKSNKRLVAGKVIPINIF